MTGEQPEAPTGDRPGRQYPGPLAYAGTGMLNAFCLLGGGALGWLVDRALGTLPAFLLVGLVAGMTVGVLATRAELRRYG
jgi:hypothetical protein